MKTELEQSDIQAIAQEVAKVLKPLLESTAKKTRAEDDVLFSVKTLAEYLHVSTQWVYERVQLKEIPHAKVGKFPRFRKKEIATWLDSQKVPAMSPFSKSLKLVK